MAPEAVERRRGIGLSCGVLEDARPGCQAGAWWRRRMTAGSPGRGPPRVANRPRRRVDRPLRVHQAGRRCHPRRSLTGAARDPRGGKGRSVLPHPPGAAARRTAPRPVGPGFIDGGSARRALSTWLGKERPLEVCATVRLTQRLGGCLSSSISTTPTPRCAPLTRLVKTILARWGQRSSPSTTTPLIKRPDRGMNLLIKKIKRMGHGSRNLAN